MAARRLILVMLVLLVASSILAALVPVERDSSEDESSSTTEATAERPPPSGELIRKAIATDDPTPQRIELALGDQLELTVSSPKLADQVEIPAFGDLEDVDPDFPARFDLLALEPGAFPVRLVEAGRVIARIEVTARGDQGGDGKSDGKGKPDRSREPPGGNTDNSTPGDSSLS
jgi:hypothetical protein